MSSSAPMVSTKVPVPTRDVVSLVCGLIASGLLWVVITTATSTGNGLVPFGSTVLGFGLGLTALVTGSKMTSPSAKWGVFLGLFGMVWSGPMLALGFAFLMMFLSGAG